MQNILLHGDNVAGLQYLIDQLGLGESIDLVYIDPPFATSIDFVVSGTRANTISAPSSGQIAYSDKLQGQDFLDFLEERLLLLRELLSKNGSIYLHIDYKIGHYVKVLMDRIFGMQNFRNDITRIKCNPKNFKRTGYGNIKDMILFYSKSACPIWNEPKEPYTHEDLERLYPKVKNGRRYTTVPIHAPGETRQGNSSQAFRGMLPPEGRHWRTDVKTLEALDDQGLIEWSSTGNPRQILFADEQAGKRVQDIWEYKDPQYPAYPTEKNTALLDRIIQTSSNPDSLVLDCFCGSGTTLKSAHLLGRQWIGIDRSDLAIQATQKKLAGIEYNLLTAPVVYDYVEVPQLS